MIHLAMIHVMLRRLTKETPITGTTRITAPALRLTASP
jgi:hypothetical protein